MSQPAIAGSKRNGGEEKKRDGPEGVEDVAAGGQAVEVLVGERAQVLVADGADRPRGGGGHSGASIRRGAAAPSLLLVFGVGEGEEKTFPLSFRAVSKCRGDFAAGRIFFFLVPFPFSSPFPISFSAILQNFSCIFRNVS